MTHVKINEVGLRDGLQNQPGFISLEKKLLLASGLLACGLKSFEVASFVHPKAVPQMADADKLVAHLPSDAADYMALVPNYKGFTNARKAGVNRISLVISISDTFNKRNINMSTQEALSVCKDIIVQAKKEHCFVRVYIATACACPFEGVTDVKKVHDMVEEFHRLDVDEISIADTTGAGHPDQISKIMSPLVQYYGSELFNLHFHDTRGLALANVWAALQLGVKNFDSSIAGLGGCPFSPGASGNLATEDLVFLLHASGYSTGVDFDKLIDAVSIAKNVCNLDNLGGKILPWYQNNKNKESL